MLIYKLCDQHLWQQTLSRPDRLFIGSAHDLRDGFIHFSSAEQLLGTLQKYFAEVDPIVLLTLDTSKLTSEIAEHLRWEAAANSSRAGLFPHLYCALPLAAIEQVSVMARDACTALLADKNWPN